MKIRLDVEEGDAGLWFVTSPDDKGLLVAEKSFASALQAVPIALEALATARAPTPTERTGE